jgi:hypothetical protein
VTLIGYLDPDPRMCSRVIARAARPAAPGPLVGLTRGYARDVRAAALARSRGSTKVRLEPRVPPGASRGEAGRLAAIRGALVPG